MEIKELVTIPWDKEDSSFLRELNATDPYNDGTDPDGEALVAELLNEELALLETGATTSYPVIVHFYLRSVHTRHEQHRERCSELLERIKLDK